MNHKWHCEHFGRTYDSHHSWIGHKSRCPLHGTSAALKEANR